jgi:hypothetical protein
MIATNANSHSAIAGSKVKTEMSSKRRLLCPYLVEQPYLATSEHSLGNTASDA